MKKIAPLFVISLFVLAACGVSQVPESSPSDTSEASIYGSWMRQATYADGILINTVPANLSINEDGSYQSSSADCATSGTQEVIDDSIAVSMTQSNCPGNIQLPYNLTYTFVMSEDGESMSMMTANVKEDYIRAELSTFCRTRIHILHSRLFLLPVFRP